jgi:peptide methionine sulfoxide reductase MsrB
MLTENQLDRDILNMLADFDEEIMRNEAEEVAFERAIRNWENDGVFDDIFGG